MFEVDSKYIARQDLDRLKTDQDRSLQKHISVVNMDEGEEVDVIVNGVLRTYIKRSGEVFYRDWKKLGGAKDVRTPTFLAHNSATEANIAINTVHTVDFDTEIFDVASNFASDTFTAPKTGKYFLHAEVYLEAVDSAATYYRIELVTSNRNYRELIDPNWTADLSYLTLDITTIADMDAGDTAHVTIYQAGGAQQTGIFGHATTLGTYFCGYLLG